MGPSGKMLKKLSCSGLLRGDRLCRRHISSAALNLASIERKWRGRTLPLRDIRHSKGKFYVLSMFPYPSGVLHMGHVRVYAIADVVARFKTMQGYHVVHPMGWDSFGLPAENAALSFNVHPKLWTETNIAKMKAQMTAINAAFDWKREISTCDASYYKWTQHLFLRLYRAGLVYRKQSFVNWDPVDQTVLANEQVDSNGCAERSGAQVEKRKLNQWFLRITDFAQDLLQDLDNLDWPRSVKQAQQHWIGQMRGLELDMEVFDSNGDRVSADFTAFTPLSKVTSLPTHIAIGIDHPLLSSTPPSHTADVARATALIARANIVRTGFEGAFTGLQAYHPTTGYLPIYLADYPNPTSTARLGFGQEEAEDQQFAQKHQIPLSSESTVSKLGSHMRPKTVYKLRDWLISRQRFWGTPVPMLHCDHCGLVPVPESELPLKLPDNKEVGKRDAAATTVASIAACPSCGSKARTDPDTMDTFLDSSWYWLRFCDPHNDVAMCDESTARALLPADLYIGGMEHATMHLLYARFISKFLQKQGIAETPDGEPFRRLLTQGMVQAETYRHPTNGRYLKRDELVWDNDTPYLKDDGTRPLVSWEKMSKSKYNGVDPSSVIETYGSDATRLYVLYKAAPSDELVWDDRAIVGMTRWLAKIWNLVNHNCRKTVGHDESSSASTVEKEALRVATHSTIKEVTQALDKDYSFHVAISFLIKLTHSIEHYCARRRPAAVRASNDPELTEALSCLTRMIAPFAPVIAEELWSIISSSGKSVFEESWPSVDQKLLRARKVVCPIMINGHTKGTIEVHPDNLSDTVFLEKLAKADPNVRQYLVDETGRQKQIQKIIFGKHTKAGRGRVISFVVAE
ncbi:hypothetical protein BC832DRAFT_552081 [Gaertneriomyces semiglobifer]|nr:hypothetical protein BC832DRAFT_552081 [Gaertneriomyces semiglobifer]